ncbi:MAG TPA: TIGR03618 family F420-dependent PPOX class oxidoreductase [Actinomycetota bacterium]|nr:TIGR03618 family F420-dependent PPOX class oxidoreductase [Actinomycetota bacterium]
MRTGLAIDQLDGLLDERLVAILATHRRDGSVLLSPVWHEWRDGGFNVWTGADDVKARHLRRDPRATIVVAESAFPMRAVEVRCEAKILEEAAEETAIRIATRFIGAELGTRYVRSTSGGHVTLRLEPGELRAWDYRDEVDSMEVER